MKLRITAVLFAITFSLAFVLPSYAATLSGTYSIPGTVAGTPVNNLSQLATMLNGSTISGTAIFEFLPSYSTASEVFPIIFTSFGSTGNVIIRPDASVTLPLTTSGSPGSNALVDLTGVTNLSFDGRPGGTGSNVRWQFQNTAVSGSYPVFLFINGAAHDTLEYLAIQSSGTSSTGTVVLSTSTVTGGNSYNTIQYCNIGEYAGYPYNPILSVGTAGSANSNNSILNNNIYDFAAYTNNSPYFAGINISATGNGSNWNISGNSLYSTINPLSQGGYTLHAVYFAPGNNSTGNLISGNYIGGTQALCGGTAWKEPSYGANGYADFDGIYVAAGGTTTVSNNTIQNIWMASKYGSSTFRGINIVSGGANVTGNTIGSATAAHSILSGLFGTMLGIQNQSSSVVTINNNTIANFLANGVSYVSGTSSTTTGVSIGIYGYNNGVLGVTSITNNQVFNFSRIDNYNNNFYFPVNTGSGTLGGIQDIYQMNVIAGICVQTNGSANQLISKNTIYNLSDSLTGATNKIFINGIVANAAGGTHTVNGNLVYGLWGMDNFGGAGYFYGLNGIYLTSGVAGTYNVTDNIVDLGYKYYSGVSVQNALIHGIWDNSTLNSTNLKFHVNHNSVFIGGTSTNPYSNNLSSYAFSRNLDYSSSVYDSLSLFNNIFDNSRSTSSGTGKNYGLYLNASLDVADDYNDVYGNGTGFYFGYAGADYVSLLAFNTTVTGHETHSISVDPLYNSPTTTTPDLHIQAGSPVDQAGLASGTIVYDYDSLLRANYSPVDIGATVVCASASPATVSLAVSQDTICTGTSVTFTATPGNGGTTPNYNFYLNGNSVQNGSSATYTNTNLNNNDSVKVVLTSSAACASPTVVTSSSIKVTVTSASTTPTVSISPSANNICQITPVTFTATPTFGGSSPTYNFYLNGVSQQNGTSATYTNNSLNNNDSVWVVMTSNAICLSTTTATSNKVHMAVITVVFPSVSIQASTNNVCPGTPITFTAVPSHGGSAPTYLWYKTNVPVGTNSASYIDSNWLGADLVKVVMMSNVACGFNDSVTSNVITIIVTPNVTPTVSIFSTSNGRVCNGGSITLAANENYGGNAPTYQWIKNGSNVATGSSYTDNTPLNGDVIKLKMTSNATCALPDTAISAPLTLSVGSSVTTNLVDSFCNGSIYSFHGQTITTAGTYYDTLQTTVGCDSVLILALNNIASPSPVVTEQGNSLSTSAFSTYQWLLNGQPVAGATAQTYIALQNGLYAVIVTNANGCTDTSNTVNVISTSIQKTADNFNVQIFPNPASDELNIRIDGIQGKMIAISLLDVYGKLIRNASEEIIGHQYSSTFNLADLSSGIYFLRIQIDNTNTTRRIELVK